jgi:hypothetical protein
VRHNVKYGERVVYARRGSGGIRRNLRIATMETYGAYSNNYALQ